MDRVRETKNHDTGSLRSGRVIQFGSTTPDRQTLESLPEKTRTIFIMSRYENKTHKEIAEHLDLSTKSIEFHITKALGVLRKKD